MGSFPLWLMAAFFAATVAFAPTSAFAHAGNHHHGQTVAHELASSAPTSDLRTTSRGDSDDSLTSQARTSSEKIEFVLGAMKSGPGASNISALRQSACDGACCNCGNCGAGCCAAACIFAESPKLPLADGATRTPLPNPLAVNGNRPASLLEPPNAFA
jgi:hypothetical protein